MTQNAKIKIITGSVTLIYWFVPVVRDSLFDGNDPNDNIFSISAFIYWGMRMTYISDSIFSAPYIVQFSLWLLSWWLLYLIARFIKYLLIKARKLRFKWLLYLIARFIKHLLIRIKKPRFK